jgi:hypothetical protein
MEICLIINSCEPYYKTALPSLLESCKLNKIPPQSIYVVIGQCTDETELLFTGEYNVVFSKHINIDYNAAIYFVNKGLSELKKYTHFFYTHDTSVLLHDFWKNIHCVAGECNTFIKIEPFFSKNTGLLNIEWFIENKTELLNEITNYDINLKADMKSGEFPNKEIVRLKYEGLPPNLTEDCIFMFDNNKQPEGKCWNNDIFSYFHKNIQMKNEWPVYM